MKRTAFGLYPGCVSYAATDRIYRWLIIFTGLCIFGLANIPQDVPPSKLFNISGISLIWIIARQADNDKPGQPGPFWAR
jgi:hypothetical protein